MTNFSGLSIAASALYAHQKSIAVIGDNIANVNTPGYAAQRAELGSIGTGNIGVFSGRVLQHGVDVTAITRRRNELLENTSRRATSDAGRAKAQAESIQSLEAQLGSLREGSLSDQLNQFFNAFDDLANEPADLATRQVLLQRADQVAGSLRSQAGLLSNARTDEVGRITQVAAEINRLAESIADLNVQVKTGSIGGQSPNSLIGTRNEQIDRLASLIDIKVTNGANNEVTIDLDGMMLVSGNLSGTIAVGSIVDPALTPLGLTRIAITTPAGRELTVDGGSLSGHLANANDEIPGMMADLDAFANDFVDQVNTLHRTGFGQDGVDGRDLYAQASPTAASVQVHSDLVGHPDRLGAAQNATATLDGSVAAQLAALGSSAGGPAAVYDAFVVKLGSQTSKLTFAADIAAENLGHADAALQSDVGVNLDEELTNLMASQRAYEAAARMITAVDETLRTLIQNTGLVGR